MLDEFIEWYYTKGKRFYGYPSDYLYAVEQDYKRAFTEASQGTKGELLRASNLGDPLAVLVLKKLGYGGGGGHYELLSPQTRNFLYTGFEVEARLLSMMLASGFKVSDAQRLVEYRGYTGHIDAILDGELVLDVKAVKDSNFKRMTGKKPYVSERYKSQLAFYRAGLDLPYAGLLVYNRDTSDVAFIDLSDDREALAELDRKLDELEKEWTLEAVWEREEELILEPTKEVFKGTETGNYLLPDEMRFTGYAEAFYHLGTGVNGYGREQVYVLGYKTVEEARQWLSTSL